MIQAWRIVKRRFADDAFSGEGARRYGGRWNTPGHPVVYVSETRALAMLEVLAGLQSPSPIPAYVLRSARFEEALVEPLNPTELPASWRHPQQRLATRRIGDRWLMEGRSLALRVPSAVVDGEFNYLLNPAHHDFPEIKTGEPEDVAFDPRLFAT